MAQNVSAMNNVSSIVVEGVVLSAGFWLVFSGRTRETVVGVMCMTVGTFSSRLCWPTLYDVTNNLKVH